MHIPSEGCGNNESRDFEGRHLDSDVGTLALCLLIIVGGPSQGERRPWHGLALLGAACPARPLVFLAENFWNLHGGIKSDFLNQHDTI